MSVSSGESSARWVAFEGGDFKRALALLKQVDKTGVDPCTQHNLVITEFMNDSHSYSEPSLSSAEQRRADVSVLCVKLYSLLRCYPKDKGHRSFIQFNIALCHLNLGETAQAESILLSLVHSQITVIRIRSTIKLFGLYLNHGLLHKARLIVSLMDSWDLESLTKELSPPQSCDQRLSLKTVQYWTSLCRSQLSLAEDQPGCSEEAMKHLKIAVSHVGSSMVSATHESDLTLDRVRILFCKSHCDLMSSQVSRVVDKGSESQPGRMARLQLFDTHRQFSSMYARSISSGSMSSSSLPVTAKDSALELAYLSNLGCTFAADGKPATGVVLIQKALQTFAHLSKRKDSAMLECDTYLSHLNFNLGVMLHEMGAYSRALDAFVLCLPQMQQFPRLWLRMSQCLIRMWQPHSDYEWNVDGQRQMNSLVQKMKPASSMKRGNLYFLPTSRGLRCVKDPPSSAKEQSDGKNDWRIEWRTRNSECHEFPYYLHKYHELIEYKEELGEWMEQYKHKLQVRTALVETSYALSKNNSEMYGYNEDGDTHELQRYMKERQQSLRKAPKIGSRRVKSKKKITKGKSTEDASKADDHGDEPEEEEVDSEDDDSSEDQFLEGMKIDREGSLNDYTLKNERILNGVDRKLDFLRHHCEQLKKLEIGSKSEEQLNDELEMRRISDMDLCVDWLTTCIALARDERRRIMMMISMEDTSIKNNNLDKNDDCLINAHLNLAFIAMDLRCWEIAYSNAQWALDLCEFERVPLIEQDDDLDDGIAKQREDDGDGDGDDDDGDDKGELNDTIKSLSTKKKKDEEQTKQMKKQKDRQSSVLLSLISESSSQRIYGCKRRRDDDPTESMSDDERRRKSKMFQNYRYLARNYLSECYLNLYQFDQSKVMLESHLKSDTAFAAVNDLSDTSLKKDDIESTDDGDLNEGSTMMSIRDYCTLAVNLACVHICESDDIERAFGLVWSAIEKDDSFVPALRLLIYLHIRCGSMDSAVQMMRDHRPLSIPRFMKS